MNNWDLYLKTVMALVRRYENTNGDLVLSIGGIDSKYTRLEKMAFDRHLNN